MTPESSYRANPVADLLWPLGPVLIGKLQGFAVRHNGNFKFTAAVIDCDEFHFLIPIWISSFLISLSSHCTI